LRFVRAVAAAATPAKFKFLVLYFYFFGPVSQIFKLFKTQVLLRGLLLPCFTTA
jgi:hypothetical protein